MKYSQKYIADFYYNSPTFSLNNLNEFSWVFWIISIILIIWISSFGYFFVKNNKPLVYVQVLLKKQIVYLFFLLLLLIVLYIGNNFLQIYTSNHSDFFSYYRFSWYLFFKKTFLAFIFLVIIPKLIIKSVLYLKNRKNILPTTSSK